MNESSIGQGVAWITGGSTGIGFAIAQALCEAGYHCVVTGRTQAALEDACARLVAGGHRADWVTANVADRAAVDEACRTILQRHGRIDVLVNNAGFNVQKRTWAELIPEEFESVIATNLMGTFYAIHAVLPSMRNAKRGTIVNVSSQAGKRVTPGGGVAYTVAKQAVFVLTESLNQAELANGIRSCVVAPGGVATRAHDWRPDGFTASMLQPEDVALAVRYAVEAPLRAAITEIDIVQTH